MTARVVSAAPPPGQVVPEKETKKIGGSINSSPMELNAEINEEEGYVEEGFQMGDNYNPSFKEDLMSHHNYALASESVLVQNLNIASPDKETSCEVNGCPIIMEVKAGESQFNANSIPSSSNQRLAPINEKTLAASPQGMVLHSLDNQDEIQSPQSMAENLGQHHSLRTWKRVMRQGNNEVPASKSKSEKKRKSSFNPIDDPYLPNKRLQVPLDFDDISSTMVEAAMQPCQEPCVFWCGTVTSLGTSVIASVAESFHLPFSVVAMEVIATKKALQFAKDLGLSSIILEGDSKIAINGLKSKNSSLNEYDHLLVEAK
nr:hypothetical protein CFP56_37401 [Quercus suber]